MRNIGILLLIIATFLTGCREETEVPVPPAVLLQRAAAFRQACAARELAAAAAEDLAILEELSDPGGSELMQVAARGAADFARAYHRHAELRVGAYALLDSAVNFATTTADSARYVERAGAFTVLLPQEGTVEANVLRSYQAKFSAILGDDDHRCNWDIPF
ncbi:MAG TPA: hypothetical protein VMN39_02860 [Longimicrobiaceae bacterium]|nr:hypothetical protein [Longimicrobiaceae bacterium]